jgi:hypothetical protein
VNPGQTKFFDSKGPNGWDYDCTGKGEKRWDKAGGQCECFYSPRIRGSVCEPAGGGFGSNSYLPAWGDNSGPSGVPDCGVREIWIQECTNTQGPTCNSGSDSCNAGKQYTFKEQECR